MLPGNGRSLGSCKLRPGKRWIGVEQERTEFLFSFGPPPPGQFDARSFESSSFPGETEAIPWSRPQSRPTKSSGFQEVVPPRPRFSPARW